MTDEFWLSEEPFWRLNPHLPTDTCGAARVDDRWVVGGIVRVIRNGLRWREAHEAYGPHKTLYNRFVRWARRGVREGVFTSLPKAGGPPAALMIDAAHVKAHRSAAMSLHGPAGKQSEAADFRRLDRLRQWSRDKDDMSQLRVRP